MIGQSKWIISLVFLVVTAKFIAAENLDDDKEKVKTDAMLFGDVKSKKEHIPFASITIKGTTIGTSADATGHFKMANLPVGKQVVLISAVGYKPFEKEVTLVSNEGVTIYIELESDVIGLEQVVVSADRNARSRKDAGTIVNNIGAKLMNRTQNVTLTEGLNFSPGLRMENNCQNCGFSQIRMNGMESHYTQILINSRPIFSDLAGVYGIELIPANMIDRVEIIRGGGSAMYGSNAIAGTVNLITKDPINNTFSASISQGVLGAGLNDKSAGAKGDYSINFNGSFVTDDFKSGLSIFGFSRNRKAFDLNNDGFSDLTSINNTTLGARLYHRVASRGKLTADFFNINEFRRGGDGFELP
jgi:outer membrane receptor for ferrienterochelin and colicins